MRIIKDGVWVGDLWSRGVEVLIRASPGLASWGKKKNE